jgi:hypothetical protein
MSMTSDGVLPPAVAAAGGGGGGDANGHNARTCTARPVKLFGVRIGDQSSMWKSVSMGNIAQLAEGSGEGGREEGYGSDGEHELPHKKRGQMAGFCFLFPGSAAVVHRLSIWSPRRGAVCLDGVLIGCGLSGRSPHRVQRGRGRRRAQGGASVVGCGHGTGPAGATSLTSGSHIFTGREIRGPLECCCDLGPRKLQGRPKIVFWGPHFGAMAADALTGLC